MGMAFGNVVRMTDEKPKRKIGDDPNPQLPPPPLSRARLAAKVEKVFEESLKAPATELAKAFDVFERVAAEGQAMRKSGRPSAPKAPKEPSLIPRRGRPP